MAIDNELMRNPKPQPLPPKPQPKAEQVELWLPDPKQADIFESLEKKS